jgi:hypothetical protein
MASTQYVVRIHGKTRAGQDYNGTGFLINAQGYVATCWHVVKGAAEILVKLPYTPDYIYEVAAKQEEEDIAVLRGRVPVAEDTPYAMLYSDWYESTKIKDEVWVLGFSAAANAPDPQRLRLTISNFTGQFGLIQLNGDVNSGDSGGPLLNTAGQVIGIVNFKDSKRNGQAMAIPVSLLSGLLQSKTIVIGAEGDGNSAVRAIDELPDLMREARVNDAVQAYGDVFEKASRQITILATYKKVHDLLHEVQYGCYDRLVMDAQHFPDDESAQDQVGLHADKLKEYTSSADEVLRGAIERGDRILKVHDQLKEVSDALQTASDHQDKRECERAIQLLRRLLYGPTPSTFNVLLNETAQRLDMGALIAAMQGVHRAITNTKLAPAKAERFQEGVKDLEELERELRLHTKEHDDLQQIDDKLRTFRTDRATLLSEVEIFWPDISSEIRAVCNPAIQTEDGPGAVGVVSNWASGLAQTTASLDTALAAGNLPQVRRNFLILRQEAGDHFHRVDKRLLHICEKISKVKDPLRTLVEILK